MSVNRSKNVPVAPSARRNHCRAGASISRGALVAGVEVRPWPEQYIDRSTMTETPLREVTTADTSVDASFVSSRLTQMLNRLPAGTV